NTLPILDILVIQPILVSLVLLPPASVFAFAFINAILIVLIFCFEPYSKDLVQVMQLDGYEVVTRPLYLIIYIVAILYPVMRSVLRAITMGDRAKELAKVQRDQAEREAHIAREKLVLDRGINQLVTVLTQTANGDLKAHAPIPEAASLRPVAGSLNMLLA